MIYLHPTVTHSPASIAEIQLATGLRTVFGNRYGRLVEPGKKTKTVTYHGLTCCTHCGVRGNTQRAGETCRRCKKGTMVTDFGGNGGSAA